MNFFNQSIIKLLCGFSNFLVFLKTTYNFIFYHKLQIDFEERIIVFSTLGISIHMLVEFDIGWYKHDTTSDNGLLQNKYWKQLYKQFCGFLGLLKDNDKIWYYTVVRQVCECVWLRTVKARSWCVSGLRHCVKNFRSACRCQNYDIHTNPYCQDFLHI